MDVKGDQAVPLEEMNLDIIINAVTASFNVKCELDLNKIPHQFVKKRSSNILTLKLNNQKATVIMRPTGKCSIMGAESETNACQAATQAVELLKMCDFQTILDDFKINIIWAYCLLPWKVRIEQLVTKHKNLFEYEPELCNQCSIKIKESGAFAAILPSGYVRIAASNREDIGNAVTHLLSFVHEFRIQ